MKTCFRRLGALLMLSALSISLSAFAAVTASVERDHMATNETIRLLIQHDGSTDASPDLTSIKRDFDILGTNQGSSVQIINGHVTSKVQISLILSPKHSGTIRIAPIEWGGKQSAAIEITVGGSGGGSNDNSEPLHASAAASHVFLTAELDRKQVYVQGASVLTVRLLADQTLYRASLDLPTNNDLIIQQLGKDVSGKEVRNGRIYQIFERKYLVLPQRSGKIRIDGAVLDAQVADANARDPFANAFGRAPFSGLLNTTQPLRVHADPVELNVQPRPANATGSTWVPAQAVTLSESWHPENGEIHVGEPLTRRIHLTATGLAAAQLPDLTKLMAFPEDVKAYPDKPQLDNQAQSNTVVSSLDQDIALIVSRAGHYTLPALKLSWWDSDKNMAQEAILPAQTINVLPAADVNLASGAPSQPAFNAPSVPATPSVASSMNTAAPLNPPSSPLIAKFLSGTNLPWQWISFALVILWLGTVLTWWMLRRRVAPPILFVDEALVRAKNVASKCTLNIAGDTLNTVRKACMENNAQATRSGLLAWAKTIWPENPPLGLNGLSQKLEASDITDLLRQLDRACYMGGDWQGEALAKLIKPPDVHKPESAKISLIPELYP